VNGTLEPQAARPARARAWIPVVAWAALAIGFFSAAYAAFPPAIVGYLFAMAQLARVARGRAAYYSGLGVGLAIGAAWLTFFFTVFSFGASALWYVYAFWLGAFVALAGAVLRRWGNRGWWLVPVLWCGLEYFRSELYYLRFSWLNAAYAFGGVPGKLGMYGFGFLLMAGASLAAWLWPRQRAASLGTLALTGLAAVGLPLIPFTEPAGRTVRVTGVQMEAPTEPEVIVRLTEALRRHPETELLVLSEYTFHGPVPEPVKSWCARNHRYLIAGGEAPAPRGKYRNTSFVVDPEGKVVFQQAKSVPIQFFADGLPAQEQQVWNSPWGRIGICICYDLSYRRVTDRLVRLGAEALIVPTMDVADWGRRQHEMHARVAPVRAAEYGIPIFRVASSGISQHVDGYGRVLATAPFPGQGSILTARLNLFGPGHLPVDTWLAPACSLATLVTALWIGSERLRRRFGRHPGPGGAP